MSLTTVRLLSSSMMLLWTSLMLDKGAWTNQTFNHTLSYFNVWYFASTHNTPQILSLSYCKIYCCSIKVAPLFHHTKPHSIPQSPLLPLPVLTGSCCMEGAWWQAVSIRPFSRVTRQRTQLDKIVWAAMLNLCSSSTS